MGECILKNELLDDTEMSCLLSRQLRLAHMFTSKKEEIGGTWMRFYFNLSKYLD